MHSSLMGVLADPGNLHSGHFFLNECPVLPFYSL